MFIPDNMKDHDIALFLQVVFPAEHFTYAQAEAITMTLSLIHISEPTRH